MKTKIDIARRTLLALSSVCLIPGAARADAFPGKSIRLVDPYPTGGTSSQILNILVQKIQTTSDVKVWIDYRTGAAGVIGVDAVLKAAPDGYTVGFTALNSFAINPHLTKKLPYDVTKDVQLVTLLGSVPNIIVVNPDVKARSLSELIALSQKSDLSYATPGVGTSVHLAGEQLRSEAGLKMLHVPYRGEAPALQDLFGGRLPVMMSNLTGMIEYVKTGRVRAIAVTSAQRASALPNVPTVAESGVPGFDVRGYFLLFTARGVPAAALQSLNKIFNQALGSPDVKAQLEALGMQVGGSSVDEATALTQKEYVRWGEVVRRTGVTWD